MADAIDKAARQVRSARKETVHELVAAVTDPIVQRRRYKTECHRYLYNDEGAVLTTDAASCRACANARAATLAELEDAARAATMLVGASA